MDQHFDLDDDGVADDLVFLGATDISTTTSIYVRRGACAHFVATLEGPFALFRSRGKSHGLHDLLGRSVRRQGPLLGDTIWVFRFDGAHYRLRETLSMSGGVSHDRLPPGETGRVVR